MNATNESNYFTKLSSINVSTYVEQKGQFSYLSWPLAVSQLRQFDSTATWEVKRFAGLPYLVTDLGVFVEVAVTVQGVTLSQIHPVLDYCGVEKLEDIAKSEASRVIRSLEQSRNRKEAA